MPDLRRPSKGPVSQARITGGEGTMITVKNRLAVLRKERANKNKESIAYWRGRIETSEDGKEAKQ